MICSSLCRVPFIAVLLSWVGENSHSTWSSFWGLGQFRHTPSGKGATFSPAVNSSQHEPAAAGSLALSSTQ